MNVTYSEKAEKASEQYALLQQATKWLEEDILGKSAGLVSAHWDRDEDEKGSPLYILRLKDPAGEVHGQFDLDLFRSPARTKFRLHRLWGALLQIHTDLQFEKLRGALGEN